MSLEAILKIKGMAEGALKAVDQVQNGMGRMAEQATRLGQRMSIGVTAPVVAGLGLAANEAIKFESALAEVQKVAEIPQGFTEDIRKMSHDIPLATSELLELSALALIMMNLCRCHA